MGYRVSVIFGISCAEGVASFGLKRGNIGAGTGDDERTLCRNSSSDDGGELVRAILVGELSKDRDGDGSGEVVSLPAELAIDGERKLALAGLGLRAGVFGEGLAGALGGFSGVLKYIWEV